MQRYYSAGFFLFLIISLFQPSLTAYYPQDFSRPVTSIAFGSCNRETLPQPMWNVILAEKPDLWIWGGDNVYGDSRDEAILRQTYEKQLAKKDYQIFRDSLPIIGIWDDHDYGQNNTGKWFKTKVASQQLLLDFLDEPKESPRRRQQGIYTGYDFGPPGKRVKILLIDNRYHADRPGPDGDLLGKDQWNWLESELATSRAQLNLIVSGIQILPEEHPYEKWANFPKTQNPAPELYSRQKNFWGPVAQRRSPLPRDIQESRRGYTLPHSRNYQQRINPSHVVIFRRTEPLPGRPSLQPKGIWAD